MSHITNVVETQDERFGTRRQERKCYHTYGCANSVDAYIVDLEKDELEDEENYHDVRKFKFCPDCGEKL